MGKKSAALLFTGGKDSCLALLKARQNGYDIKYLLAILPSSFDSWMWHKPFLALLNAQAKALGIPLITQKSKTQKEKEVLDLEKLLKKAKDIDYVLTGGIASNYQRERIEKTAKKFNLKVVNPLWGMKAIDVWQESLKNKFEIILTKIACEGIGPEWLGKIIDKKLFNELTELSKKYGFSLEFEGGGAETEVLDMTLFKKKIEIDFETKSETPYRHFLIIKKATLKNK